MTRDDIMRMAKNEYGIYAFTAESLAHFAALVAAAEREACAKIADGELRNQTLLLTDPPKSGAAWAIAAAIRARRT